jgi:hypothetical protein
VSHANNPCRHIAFFGWSIAIWVSWTPLIAYRQVRDPGDGSAHALGLIGRILFASLICSGIVLCEKIAIQWIAQKFHEQSYAGARSFHHGSVLPVNPAMADRIEQQRFAVRTIVTLYRHSFDIPGCPDTLNAGHAKNLSVDPRQLLKHAKHSFRKAATTATTALGGMVSEIAGRLVVIIAYPQPPWVSSTNSAILQPNSPQAMVKTALQSANKSRLVCNWNRTRCLFFPYDLS